VPDQTKRDVDAGFWSRADAHIGLANQQCDTAEAGKVSASLLYAATRFNAFILAAKVSSAESLLQSRASVEQPRKSLERRVKDEVSIQNVGACAAQLIRYRA